MINLLCRQAHYVDEVSQGDPEIIKQAGFNVIHTSSIKTKNHNLVVRNGMEEGQMFVEYNHGNVASAYIWEYALHPMPVGDKYWIQAGVSKEKKFTITGLKSNSKVWFRAAMVTEEGQHPWCKPVLKDIL